MSERGVSDLPGQLLNLMKDTLTAAVEATTKTQEQTLRFYDDLAKRGGLAQQEGQRLVEDWLKTSRENFEAVLRQARSNLQRWEESVPKSMSAAPPVTKQDLEALTKKIEALTRKVDALSRSS